MMVNKQSTLGDQAYTALREKVAALESGTYLSTRQFAKEIGISYTPVREAFLRLKREGMLRQIENVGYFVASMDISDMIQAFQVRECIEPYVLQKVFNRIEDIHIGRMREYVKLQQEYLEKRDIVQYMKTDIKLHGVFIDLFSNQHLKSTYYMVREMYMFCSNKVAKNLVPYAFDEHTQLINAIENREEALSIELLKGHIEEAKQRMMEGYTNVGK
ncbi:MAG: GntR family transcriptional regulator [Clostridiales bacterium]|nr:GntR family transcriptional regulator [Clostridiales bacterium]